MDLSQFDTIVWWSLRIINIASVYFITCYWVIPLAWGKTNGNETFYWTRWKDSKGHKMNFGLFTFLMEFPTFIWSFALFPFGQHASNPKAWILMAPYTIHYLHRTFIYAYLTSGKHTQTIYSWFIFPGNFVSYSIACSNTRLISDHIDYDNDTWFWFRVFVGGSVYLYGLYIRIWADHYMTALKGEDGTYKIPKGWWFEVVESPHFLGELMEWFGWTIMTGSLVTFSYFFYVFSLLTSRAYHTRKFYLKKFEDYPKNKKMLFPYVW